MMSVLLLLALFQSTPPPQPTPPPVVEYQDRRVVLANWLASPQNPLTARVIVNRVWQYHFGKGITTTASDFGSMCTRTISSES